MSILQKKPVLYSLVILTGLYLIYYIFWRAAYTLNESALIFSILLLTAEIQGVISFFLFAMMTWNIEQKTPPPVLSDAIVDVFVPTYNEDLTIIEATLVGCVNMRYPHKTYVLDDGHRPEVRALAEKMGCLYLSREENKHAKAGNINEALKKTSGEYIVVLDADMVPQPDFLEKTLGYFRDKKTAIVQMPQEFYNIDSMQHNKRRTKWHEQQLFYHVIQPGKDRIGAAFWCGSPSVVRRAALRSIGGVATESITEDFLTSIRLNAKGWRIRYHHEVLAFGIAPQSFHAFSVQRLRWAQGSMKILKSRDNPLLKPGLTLRQRLSHFAAIFTYFDAYQKLIFLLAPVILLLTGVLPIKTSTGLSFLWHWIPYFCLTMLTNIALGRGYFKFFAVEKFNILKMVTFIKASFSLIWSKGNFFRVTPKSVEASLKKKDKRELTVHLALLSLIAASILFASFNSIWAVFILYPSFIAVAVALFWSIFNLFLLALAMHEVLSRLYMRQDYRFSLSLCGHVSSAADTKYRVDINNISRGGLSMHCSDMSKKRWIERRNGIGINTTVSIELPEGDIILPGQIVYDKESSNSLRSIGFKFGVLPDEIRMRLYNFLFVTAPRNIYSRKDFICPASTRQLLRSSAHINQGVS